MMLLIVWTLLCLPLTSAGTTVGETALQCSVSPVGALHPVHAQLERFEAGPGCAAREGGAKETHVIVVGGASHHPIKQVSVVLRPLSYSHPVSRPVILVLSSQHAVHWVLESEGLPWNLHMLVQVSSNSTLKCGSGSVRVHSIPLLPWRPRALLQWTLQRHSTISSLIHSARANHVYLRLGEDPSMPSVCHLQSLFLSHNYLMSEVQEQEVSGCAPSARHSDPEVHIIKLWSAGSGLCGSFQVEVSVSLQPGVANAGWCNVVLVLSSASAINLALVTPGLRGHITVHSSHSVTPLYPPRPDLTMSSVAVPNLSVTSDLLDWAGQNGYPSVASYTEAHQANRFVIKLRGGGAVQAAMEAKVEETRLRHWLSGGVRDGQEAIGVQCTEGRLTVSVDKSILQALSLSVSAVTLRDTSCQAWSNGSHFLLAFPVVSCGTDGEIDQHGGGVQYKNRILLWKNQTQDEAAERRAVESAPLVINFSCLAPLSIPAPVMEQGPASRPEEAPRNGAVPDSLKLPVPRSGSPISMKLFATEEFERTAVGPCVVTARGRVYAQISVSKEIKRSVEVFSCVFSPLSDPRAHVGWSVLRDSCPADPSFILHGGAGPEDGAATRDEAMEEEDEGGSYDQGKAGNGSHAAYRTSGSQSDRRRGPRGQQGGETMGTGQLRFSFVLRPAFNNSIQFLHCTLQLCGGSNRTHGACAHPTPIPALIRTRSGSQECEYRNLTRPVLVTYSPDALAGLLPLAGQLAQKPRVSETEASRQSSSSDVTSSILISVFAAFLMGVGLMGALWCIYSCTGRPVTVRRECLTEIPSPVDPVDLLQQTSSAI